MAKSTARSRKKQAEERAAAKAAADAAERALLEQEDELDDDIDGDGDSLNLGFNATGAEPNEDYAKEDVFEEGFKKALAQNTSPRYHIKQNSQFIGVEGYPFSWEALQKKYGPGYYQIIAKAMSNGQILKKQSEMVGNPLAGKEPVEEEVENPVNPGEQNLAILGFLQSSQERADARARESAKAGESNMATMMQAISVSQQENTKMMMNMMAESNRQTMTIMTTLMTQPRAKDPMEVMMPFLTLMMNKKPDNDGFTAASVFKMVEDARRDGKSDAKETMRMIDEKARKMADDMAPDGDGEESLTRTVVKAIAPVLAEVMKNQQAATAQQAQLTGQAGQHQNPPNTDTRPAIGAARPPNQPPVRRPVPQVVPNPAPNETAAAKVVTPAQGPDASAQAQPQEIVVDSRLQETMFNFCAGDIGNAMLQNAPASKTARECLGKLEKEGLPRQTVKAAFKLEDFYAYAAQYGLPEEAKPWLKEFHEAITLEADKPPRIVRPPAAGATANGQHAVNGSGQPVAAERSKAARTGPRVQPRKDAQSI